MSRTFVLNKLVRDNIVDDMSALGQKVSHRILSDDAYIVALKNKIVEEAQELQSATDKGLPTEVADLRTALDALIKALALPPNQLDDLRQQRDQKRGGFSRGLFVEQITLQDTDPWVKYYAAQPKRYQEL